MSIKQPFSWRVRQPFQATLLGLLLLALTALGGLLVSHHLSGESAHGLAGGPIELDSTKGHFSLDGLASDQVAVVSFGYTYCPDVCPMNQAVKRQALGQLSSAEQARVVPLMISLDPARDTMQRLTQYTEHFGDRFVGATGTEAELRELAGRYGVVWRKVDAGASAMEYTIDHSSAIYLVDAKGEIVKRVPYSPSPHDLTRALKDVLSS